MLYFVNRIIKLFLYNFILYLTKESVFYIIRNGGVSMTISQKIKMALAYKGMSEAELARTVGSSPQAFNQRMKTGKFSSEEMERIAEALEATYYFGFEFKDGTKI